ncbi:L-gulonolactone oxidase 3-like [Salvia divinorum]|uniref:L-gulonolactone oxidase 3-like n=1 Tax=Salvia divinorum TaxID=28513 RepID=A0ABD1HF60_SALDI
MVVAARESKGFARVVDLRKGDVLFSAAKVYLGLLGVISKKRAQCEKGKRAGGGGGKGGGGVQTTWEEGLFAV